MLFNCNIHSYLYCQASTSECFKQPYMLRPTNISSMRKTYFRHGCIGWIGIQLKHWRRAALQLNANRTPRSWSWSNGIFAFRRCRVIRNFAIKIIYSGRPLFESTTRLPGWNMLIPHHRCIFAEPLEPTYQSVRLNKPRTYTGAPTNYMKPIKTYGKEKNSHANAHIIYIYTC